MISRVFKAIAVLLFAVACAPLAASQTAASEDVSANPRNVDASQFGGRITLGPDWLFAPGDNPAWASPAFDDSGWKTIATDKPLLTYGIHDIPFAWYRTHIHLRPGTRNLMVGTMDIGGQYEIFANGVRIGGTRDMIGQLSSWQNSFIAYAVPDNLIAERGDLVLAIRCRLNWGSSLGHGASTPLWIDSIYLVSRESAPISASYIDARIAGPHFLLCCLSLLASSISFALFIALRRQREYLAIAIYLLCSCVVAGIVVRISLYFYSFPLDLGMFIVLGVETFALIEFVRMVLQMPRTRWLLALEIVAPLAFLVNPIHNLGLISHNVFFAGFFLPVLGLKIVLPLLLLKAWRRGNREAGLLLPAILIGSLADYWQFFRNLVFYAKLDGWLPVLPFRFAFGSYEIDVFLMGDFIFDFTVLFFLVQRTVRIARERNRVAAELEAARTTQQLLLSRCSQPTPGFHVEAIYHPASEVGGDFFEVSSMPDGGLIAIIGDVSGKGLKAAMRVAMILGVLRRESSWEPAQVLRNLNEALHNPGEDGFTTACCVQIEPSGRYTLANAGHIAPYIDGREVATPPSLPLGLTPDQHYATVTGSLAAEQKIVLLSDGVVEARSTIGELLGFERLAHLTLQSARAIADTAKAFGQDDDITVLTLARTA